MGQESRHTDWYPSGTYMGNWGVGKGSLPAAGRKELKS